MTVALGLEGKIALVTGGGGGIGRAIAEAYAELDAHVIVAEIDEARAANVRESLGRWSAKSMVLVADVRNQETVRKIIDTIDAEYGHLDILVNNVGDAMGLTKPFADTTPAEWEMLYDVNLKHVFLVTHAAIPLLRKSTSNASIVNLSSIEGLRGYPMGTVYTAFKTGIVGFTRSLACELGPENIRVNAIASETSETEAIQIVKSVKPEFQDHVKRWFPMGRYGTPQDSAGAAIYLASDLALWVTGHTMLVDGGALAQGGWRQMRTGEWTNSPIIDEAHRAYGPAAAVSYEPRR